MIYGQQRPGSIPDSPSEPVNGAIPIPSEDTFEDTLPSSVVASSQQAKVGSKRPGLLRARLPRPGTKTKWLPILAAGCAYLALGFLASWQAWSQGVSHTGAGSAFDPVLFYWSLGYFAHFLGEPSHWFTTTVLARPGGVNLLDNTSVPLLGVLTAPITLIWGPVASANVLTVTAIGSSGFTTFLLARQWTKNTLAGFCAGIIEIVAGNFGSSAAFGHLMTLAFFVPPLLLLVAKRALENKSSKEQPSKTWTQGCLFGVLLVIQFFISTEIFADEVLLTALAIVVCLALFWRQSSRVAKKAAKFFLTAIVTSLVLLAWPIWEAVEGPFHVTGPAHPKLVGFGVRLPLVVLPTSTKEHFFCLMDGLHHCTATLPPGGLGIPLIAAGLTAMVITWHRPLARFASTMTLVSFLLAMGSHPVFHAHGKAHAPIPLPFALLAHLPLLENLGPTRLMKFVALFLAIVIGFAIDELATWNHEPCDEPLANERSRTRALPKSWLSLGAVAVSLAALVPILPNFPYQQTTIRCPKFFTTEDVDAIAPGSVAVTYPFPSDTALGLPWSQAMLWQACSGFRFSLVGGYVLEPHDTVGESHAAAGKKAAPTFFPESRSLLARTIVPPGLPGSSSATQLPSTLAEVLNGGPDKAHILAELARELRKWKVDVVLISPKFPRSQDVTRLFTILLGEPPTKRGGIRYWIGVRKVLG